MKIQLKYTHHLAGKFSVEFSDEDQFELDKSVNTVSFSAELSAEFSGEKLFQLRRHLVDFT